ncbi:fungal-specific transcription factor domain-containing protein [Penicillium mononematosum]|uniref:fungal-specific transcription factor domain-containing protein n=1 Tax=Penicillium mononematosum TaxID=268346 RepID=UPI002548B04D|nr:fungal-specific transcription factor domain-containing protein [Penicillium mononematosum]KAJ6185260.1 fungal-specific transcription factor domain-containing protein [Penicillium mononematosum]
MPERKPSSQNQERMIRRRLRKFNVTEQRQSVTGAITTIFLANTHAIKISTRTENPALRLTSPVPSPLPPPAESSDEKLHLPGLALGNICVFNGLPFFSPGGREWIRKQTGEDVSLNQYNPPRSSWWLRPATAPAVALPSEEHLKELLEAYESSPLAHIFPFIYPPLFRDTVRKAYREQRSGNYSNADAMACIFAFIAVSSICFFARDPSDNMINYASASYDMLPSLCRGSITVDGLQALLLLSFYSQAVVGDILSTELLVSTAQRFVFHLGGHISPGSRDNASKGPPGVRLHVRNLFWICYVFNQELSLRTGLPPNLTDVNCDLTLPEAPRSEPQGLTSSENSGCSPILFQFAQLATIQSQIYRRLYSVTALSQTDAELLCTIRDLDELLDDWKHSIPSQSRPSFKHRRPEVEDITSSILQVQYHYCMVTIHQASGRCISWTQNTRGPGSSLAINVQASRSLLQKFSHFELRINRYNLLFCLPYLAAAMIHLFCDILLHPLDPVCHSDLALMDTVRDHMMAQLWSQAPTAFRMQVHFVKDLSCEIQRLARSAIYRAGG